MSKVIKFLTVLGELLAGFSMFDPARLDAVMDGNDWYDPGDPEWEGEEGQCEGLWI